MYGSAVWRLNEHRLTNNVQNRTGKIFLGVSNIAVQGDLGSLSCLGKQRLEVLGFYLKL